ncbi:Utp11 protein [Giardia duodenalis]|uniref:Utp11 protein n=1 Tax=Giardia intestinalis TaxID=5741 RepID=V6TNL4_GIAIN|nr:Utp11 protein [Giardia intestinalis]
MPPHHRYVRFLKARHMSDYSCSWATCFTALCARYIIAEVTDGSGSPTSLPVKQQRVSTQKRLTICKNNLWYSMLWRHLTSSPHCGSILLARATAHTGSH